MKTYSSRGCRSAGASIWRSRFSAARSARRFAQSTITPRDRYGRRHGPSSTSRVGTIVAGWKIANPVLPSVIPACERQLLSDTMHDRLVIFPQLGVRDGTVAVHLDPFLGTIIVRLTEAGGQYLLKPVVVANDFGIRPTRASTRGRGSARSSLGCGTCLHAPSCFLLGAKRSTWWPASDHPHTYRTVHLT